MVTRPSHHLRSTPTRPPVDVGTRRALDGYRLSQLYRIHALSVTAGDTAEDMGCYPGPSLCDMHVADSRGERGRSSRDPDMIGRYSAARVVLQCRFSPIQPSLDSQMRGAVGWRDTIPRAGISHHLFSVCGRPLKLLGITETDAYRRQTCWIRDFLAATSASSGGCSVVSVRLSHPSVDSMTRGLSVGH